MTLHLLSQHINNNKNNNNIWMTNNNNFGLNNNSLFNTCNCNHSNMFLKMNYYNNIFYNNNNNNNNNFLNNIRDYNIYKTTNCKYGPLGSYKTSCKFHHEKRTFISIFVLLNSLYNNINNINNTL